MRVPDEGSVSLLDFFQDDERDALAGGIERLVSGEVDRIVSERELRRADGTAVWFRLQSSVLCDDAGEPVAIVAHVQDIEAEPPAAEGRRSKHRWLWAIVERSHAMLVRLIAGGRS